MHTTTSPSLGRTLVIVAAAALLAACDDEPSAPERPEDRAVATLRTVTERYKDLELAKADGFVFLHGCENRPGEGPVGMVYVHPGRLMDGLIDPSRPDALVYEPHAAAPAELVGIEFAMPYTLWTEPGPPRFLGNAFQPEDEFGVFGLHVWVWRDNPRGLFEEANPNVTCS